MSKIVIENYRGFAIEFDTDYEKFQCIITEEKSKESNSFSQIKKFIDDYKKENQNFKSFYIQLIPKTYSFSTKRMNVVGIRKDGRFIVESEGKKEQLSDYYEKDYMLETQDNDYLMEQLNNLEEKEKLQKLQNDKLRKELISKLKITSLTEFKKTLIQ